VSSSGPNQCPVRLVEAVESDKKTRDFCRQKEGACFGIEVGPLGVPN
jgi:hypothetical protein